MEGQQESDAQCLRVNVVHVEYDDNLQAFVLRVEDPGIVYPVYWRDPQAGVYRIEKTRAGRIKMGR